MCIATAGAGVTAAAAAATNAGLAISAVSTVASIGMGIMSAQQQAAQAQQQVDLQNRQRMEQASLSNQAAQAAYNGKVKAQQASHLSFYKQLDNINSGVNKTYIQEQLKFEEAQTKAAFKSQDILRKSIGAQGKILASGATGQSVGLLALDADRQAGFAQSQTNASVDSAAIQGAITQDVAFDQAQSSANQAFSRTDVTAQAPILDPYGMAGLNIPT